MVAVTTILLSSTSLLMDVFLSFAHSFIDRYICVCVMCIDIFDSIWALAFKTPPFDIIKLFVASTWSCYLSFKFQILVTFLKSLGIIRLTFYFLILWRSPKSIWIWINRIPTKHLTYLQWGSHQYKFTRLKILFSEI